MGLEIEQELYRLIFSIIRATNLCLCGSRVKWRGVGLDNGDGLPYFFDQ